MNEPRVNEPWRLNPAWRDGKIRSGGAPAFLGISAFALAWCAIIFPVIILNWDEIVATEDAGAYLIFLFPLVGVGMLSYALYLGWRRYVYGVPLFMMERVPGVLGGSLAGRIAVKVAFAPEAGIALRLMCLNRQTTGSGKNRSTTEEILWQDERMNVRPVAAGDPSETWIPVRFAVPVDLPPSGTGSGGQSFIWRLDASADVPGVDFAASFTVPVFATAESSSEQTESALREKSLHRTGAGIVPPADAGIAVRRSAGGGREFLLRAGRNAGAGIGGGVIGMVFMGIVVALVLGGAPLIFPVIFSLFGLIILYGLVQMSFGETAFVIEEKDLSIRHTLFGIMSGRRIPRSDVERVTVREGGRAGSTRLFAIVVVRKGGAALRGMGLIRSRQHAEWLAAEIERSCREA